MSEFLAKWVAAAFLLGFAWRVRARRGRALGLFLAALALLAFEVGLEESLLELACAALLAREARAMKPGGHRGLGWVAVATTCAALAFFAVRPWVAAAVQVLS